MSAFPTCRAAKTSLVSLCISLVSVAAHGSQHLEGRLIKEIRIPELRHTKEELVRTQLYSRVGGRYSEESRRRDMERLDRLRIFSRIEVSPVEDEGDVILDVDVEETIPYIPTLSLEVTDENGVAGGPGVKSVNFLGRGIALSAAAKFGSGTNIDFILEGPWRPGRRWTYALQLFHRERPSLVDDFEESSTDINLRVGTNVGENGRIGGRLAIYSLGSDVDGITLSPSNRDNVPSLGFFVGYDSRDRATDPRRGFWNEIEVLKRGGSLGGASSFWTLNADVRRFETLASKHTGVLSSLFTVQSGVIGVDVPIHQDFHIGGTNTVRGHDLDSLSGKNQWLNTAEYRYRLLEPTALRVVGINAYLGIQAAAFVDWGFAWTEPTPLTTRRSIVGYGVGLRLLVPFIDMVRIDFAWGEAGGTARFHFGIFEKSVMQRARVR